MRAFFLLSWRFFVTPRKEKFLSLISIISIFGVAIGVAALIVVLAVMSGFDRDLRDKIVGNYAHITAVSFAGLPEQEIPELSKKLLSSAQVRAVSPFIQGQMLIKEGQRYLAVDFKGIDPLIEKDVSKVASYLVSGSLDELGIDTVIIGKELSAYLGLNVGSQIKVFSPLGKEHALSVVGIFDSGMYEYDSKLVFLHLKTAQKVLGLGDKVSGLTIKLADMWLADKIVPELSGALGSDFILRSWTQANANFFAALALEKLTMFIILILIVIVAAFNIVSTLVVMVVNKTKEIGILKALGMTMGAIRWLFVLQGLIIGLLGSLSGGLLGVGLCVLLDKYQFIKLPQDIYYIDRLPVALKLWPDITIIMGSAFLITLAATIYPALKASRLAAVDALRYE